MSGKFYPSFSAFLSAIVVFFPLLAPSSVGAQATNYITDSLRLEARSGPSTGHRIVRMLRTGTEVRVLERSPEGYTKIQTDDGAQVWILNRYLRADPPVRDQLDIAKADLERVNKQLRALQDKLNDTTASASQFSKDKDSLESEKGQLEKELREVKQAAAGTLSIRNDNRTLRSRVTQLEQTVEELRAENSVMSSSRDQEWFIAGGGVLVGGMILGLIIPKLRFGRRRSWGEL